MESARLSSQVRILCGAWLALVVFALAVPWLLTPAAVFAAPHNNPVVGEDGYLCVSCHRTSSSSGAVEAGTNFIITNNRTLQNMKIALGDISGPAPVNFGCTFCHNNDANTKMKGVLSHFTSPYTQTSSHPIGETYNGWTGPRTNTKNEYLSNIDGNTGLSNELECTDCHLISLLDDDGAGVGLYTHHVDPTNALRVANPYMLKSVSLAGQYDNFCRTCHTAATGTNFQGNAGVNIYIRSHGDDSIVANAIKENDGTPIKTGAVAGAKCTYCHTGHFSGSKKLFKDTFDTSIGTKCVDCHQSGDTVGNFDNHGHGMSTSSKGNNLNYSCTACHDVNTAHDPSDSSINAGNPKMLGFTADTGTSKYGKSRNSICLNCHSPMSFAAHSGTTAQIVGCLDCHDEHAEGSGSVAGGNRYMIPQNLPNNNATTEQTFFQSNGDVAPGVWDYYVANGNSRAGVDMGAAVSVGMCDNSICHAGKSTNTIPSTPLAPLSTLMTSVNHTGDPQSAGTECVGCHTHTDGAGSWAASESCTGCHGQPPVSEATGAAGYAFSPNSTNESLTPHTRHVVDYGYGCAECHNKMTASPPHREGTATYKSVWFNQTMNPATAAYPTTGDYVGTTYTCNNLYCHSDGQFHTTASQKDGEQWMTSASAPDWNAVGNNLSCEYCHGAVTADAVGSLSYGAPDHGNSTPVGQSANSHDKHPYACAVCHNSATQDMDPAAGWAIDLGGKKHVNGSIDLVAGPGYSFSFTTASHTCSGISCHGGNPAIWGGASLSCDGCHFRTTAAGGDLNNYALSDGTPALINTEEWTTTGHGRTTAYPGYPTGNVAAGFVSTSPTDLKGCMYCHDSAVTHATTANPFRLRNKLALPLSPNTADNAFGWNDNCLVCHSTLDVDGFDPDGALTSYNPENGKNVDQNHYGGSHIGFPTRGGTFCWDCHDPHGDNLQFMFHGTNGGLPGNGVTQTSDGLYGVPTTSRPVTSFDATAGAGTPVNFNSSDYVNAANTGLCQTCHTTAAYYNQSTNTPLTSHNGADTQRCTTCHAHTADFTPSGCDGCHGNPPLPRPIAGTTQTWVSDNAALTQGDHTAHNGYGVTDCNNTCHVVTTHKTNKTSADMGARAATAAASTGVHKYSTIDNVDVWTGNTAGITSVVDDSCVNVSCHNSTYSSNAWKSSANPTYVRYWNNSFDCYTCHAYDGQVDSTIRPNNQTSVTTDWIATGSHDQHINRNGYAIACTNCHDTAGYTAARAGLHGNGSVNFVGNFGAIRAGGIATGGIYDTNGATGGWAQVAPFMPTSPAHAYFCGNVYCHSTGKPRGAEPIVYPATTQWTMPNSGNCGTCHTTTGSALITNVHEKHTGSAADQYGYACQTCHFTVVDATGTAIVAGGYALHVNGTNNAAFAANAGTYAYTGGTVGAVGGTCSSTYCHSKGLDFSAPYTGTNTAATVVADWDIAVNGLGCFGCHGDGLTIAYPSYTNDTSIMPGAISFAKKNSHVAHNSFGCQICHSGTTTTGTSITTKANHATGSWQISQPASGYTFTVAGGTLTDAAYTPVTCSTISCHGNGTAVWGATLTCFDCHGVSAESAALGGASNSIANQVTQAEWTNTGHGLAAGQYDLDAINGGGGNPAANKGCYTTDANGGCHVSTVTHVPAPADDPYRLGATYKADLNGLCLQASCHSTVSTNHHNDDVIANAATAYNFETKCVDCHDPHGDSNMFMVHSAVAVDGADVDTPAAMSAVTGVPDTTKAVTFVADTNGSDYSDTSSPYTGPFTGICEVCHTQTRWYQGTIANSKAGPQTGHAYITNCASCHQHPMGFQGSGCDGCHGNGAGQNWPDGTGPGYENSSPGAHVAHVNAIAGARGWTTDPQKNGTCDWCHANPGSPRQGTYTGSTETSHDFNSLSDSTADVIGDGRVTAGDATFYNNASTRVADANGSYDRVTQRCSNIDCHGNQVTLAWIDTVAPGTTSTLVAAVGTAVGTVNLTWTAPGDDGTTGTAVAYDVRYSTAIINTDPLFTAATPASGAPMPLQAGTSQGMTVTGLTPGTTYFFCIKAKDNATPTPLWSAISNSPSAAALADTTAPVFGGITSATNAGTGAVNLAWSAATDATLPITYRIWVSSTTPIVFTGAYSYTTQGLDYQVTTGLTNGTPYYFGVRAADAAGTPNVSTNTEEASATPSAGGFPPTGTSRTFYLRQSNTATVFTNLLTNTTPTCGTATAQNFPATEVPPNDLTFSGGTAALNNGTPNLRAELSTTAGVCAGATGNNLSNGLTAFTGRRWGQAFYYNTAYAAGARVCGNATGSGFAFRAGNATDVLNIWFAAVQGSSTYTRSANSATLTGINTAALAAYNAVDLSAVCVDIPAGGKLAVLFDWNVTTGVATRQAVATDGNSAVTAPVALRPGVSVTEYLNNPPNTIGALTAPLAGTYSGNVNITWGTVTDPNVGDTVHYDVYGSTDGGATFPYVIASDLAAGPATWNTIADNIGVSAANANVRVKVVAGDQYGMHNTGTQSVTITVNNTSANDLVAPGAITLAAATSLTPGAVNLTWNATGDDGAVGRATSYDIRYSTAAISSDPLFTSATQVTGEPAPQTSGTAESFTVGGLTPATSYFFAIKAGDDKPTANFGALSNSPTAIAGANCGICHGMPPTNAATGGGHLLHATGQADCGDCHGTGAAAYTSSHSNGSLELGWKTAAPFGLALPRTSLPITFTQSATTIYSDAGGGGGVDTFTGSDNIDNGTCSGYNLVTGCHPSGKTAIWGATTGCTTCHGYPPTTANANHVGGTVVNANHDAANITTKHDECSYCHGLKATGGLAAPKSPMVIMPTTELGGAETYARATNHIDGSIELNGDNPGIGGNLSAGYNAVGGWCSTGKCHAANTLHSVGPGNTTTPRKLLELGSGSCEGCHDGTNLGGIAGTIKLGSPHTKNSRTAGGVTTAATSCDDCHPGNTKGATHSKNGDANVVVIPNLTILSNVIISSGHVVDGTTSGVVLGGDVTTGQTEAEICWNCHSPTAGLVPNGAEVSEWGTNTDTNATSPNFNFGTLSAPSWFSGTWTSANFKYKTGLLSSKPTTPKTLPTGTVAGGGSVHTANPTGAPWNGPTAPSGATQIDTAAQVRCSYCHNVHGGTNGGGSVVGKPFLRGTWKGNPYREDGAPRVATEDTPNHTYTVRANYGAVPRGNSSANDYGGYQIDQNNGSPASTWTVATSAGLCALCHGGTGTDWNQFSSPTTPAQDWSSGLNSHRAVVAGETAASYFNLFGGARRHPSVAPYPTAGNGGNSAYRTAPWMSYMQLSTSAYGYGFRGSKGYKMTPTLTNSKPYGQKSYNWGATVDYATVNTNYHRFSCSKCHNPHASRLPRLLITNCLDTKVNTWEDGNSVAPAATYSLENRNVKTSNLTSAQNCHRRRDPAFAVPAWTGMPASDGWNNVSPW